MTLDQILGINDLVLRAYEYAKQKHAGQVYGGQPYEYHLFRVTEVLKRFGITDPVILAAAWLHDVLEDTDTTLETLTLIFGKEVANLVWAVSDEEGKNRKERKANVYRKIRETEKADILKLADRIANVEEGIETRAKVRFMYLKEHSMFMEELFCGQLALTHGYADPRARPMWAHLIGLMKRIEAE